MKKVVMLMLMIVMMREVNVYGGKGLCCCCDSDEVERMCPSNMPMLGENRQVVVCNSEELRRHFRANGDCKIVIKFPIKTERSMRAGRGNKSVVYGNHAFDFNDRETVNARTTFEYDGMYSDYGYRITEPRVL